MGEVGVAWLEGGSQGDPPLSGCGSLGDVVRAGPGGRCPAFEYRVPFGIMDTAQSWPFVFF